MDEGKNHKKLEPLYMPELYARHFDGHENNITVAYEGSDEPQTFELLKRFDDPATSFSGVVMLNKADGHAVILYKGMDLPGRDEGSGRAGFIKDFEGVRQAQKGQINMQTAPAEKLYLETLGSPGIRTLEIVGYSIGSQYLNYMAARHGAKGTAIADMGISDNVLNEAVKSRAADPDMSQYSLPEITAQMRQGITVLHLSADKLPKWFAAGPSRGTIIDLDAAHASGGKRSLKDWFSDRAAIAHIPQIYEAHADAVLERTGKKMREDSPEAANPAPVPSVPAASSGQTPSAR